MIPRSIPGRRRFISSGNSSMFVAQYLIYLLVGTFYIVLIGAYMTVAAGFGLMGAILISAPIIVAGFCSGLSLFYPRSSAAASIILIAPFVYVGIAELIYPSPASVPFIFLLPALLVMGVSMATLIWKKNSVWSRIEGGIGAKIPLLIFAFAPALCASYILFSFFAMLR